MKNIDLNIDPHQNSINNNIDFDRVLRDKITSKRIKLEE
jgi:hypothetical protein